MRAYARARCAVWFFDTPDAVPVVATRVAPGAATVGHSPAAVTRALRQASETEAGRAAIAAASGAQLAALVPGLPPDFRTSYEAGMAAVADLPLQQRLDVLHGYNDMSSALMAWLRTRVAGGAAVTAADVNAFFAGLASDRRVRQRTEAATADA